jgi:hypothetical protein
MSFEPATKDAPALQQFLNFFLSKFFLTHPKPSCISQTFLSLSLYPVFFLYEINEACFDLQTQLAQFKKEQDILLKRLAEQHNSDGLAMAQELRVSHENLPYA